MKVKGDEKDTDAMGRNIEIGARLPQMLARRAHLLFNRIPYQPNSPAGLMPRGLRN